MSAAQQVSRAANDTSSRLTGTALGLDLAAHVATFGALPEQHRTRRGHTGALVHEVDAAGLAGRGGGWFPTGRKMHAVATAARHARKDPVVVVNAMEGEPAASKDAVLVDRTPHLVLDGAVAAAQSLGASVVHVVAHRGSPAAATLQAAVEQRQARGHDRVELKVLDAPGRYVASEESALAHYVGEGIALPVTVPPRVFESGVRRRPTLLSNAETFAHIALIARYGAAWFRSVGDPSAPGTMLVTVRGAVANPGVVEVPTGTTVRTLLTITGGSTAPLTAVLTGGYGGAWVAAGDALEAPWTPAGLRPVGGVPGAGVLIAVSTSTCGLVETSRVATWMAGQSAGQCGPCRFGLAAVADDLERLAGGRLSRTGLTTLQHRLGIIPGRGACRHPDGVSRFAATALTVFADEVRTHLTGRCSAPRGPHVLPVPSSSVSLPVARPGEEWR
jgi:NADH:ubiquinone oxidoreductase subunit F (NADH-binding)